MAGYRPFDETDLPTLYKKVSCLCSFNCWCLCCKFFTYPSNALAKILVARVLWIVDVCHFYLNEHGLQCGWVFILWFLALINLSHWTHLYHLGIWWAMTLWARTYNFSSDWCADQYCRFFMSVLVFSWCNVIDTQDTWSQPWNCEYEIFFNLTILNLATLYIDGSFHELHPSESGSSASCFVNGLVFLIVLNLE